MFTKMKNIDTAFRYVRGFTMLVIAGCVIICCFTLYKSYQTLTRMQDRVYILAQGKVLEAYLSERKDNIAVEARDHVKTFHQYFFTLDPDEKVIRENLTRALYLADQSAKRIYDDLKESGYYSSVISGNISQRVQIDSIQIDTGQYPYGFSCFATQKIIRSTSIVKRSLLTRGMLRSVSRSDNNPHGFLIERWITLENRDLSTENRK